MMPTAAASAAVRRAPRWRNRGHAIATIALGAGVAWIGLAFVRWAVVHAIWTLAQGDDSSLCRAARSEGACWAVIGERARFILFGAYPFDEHWRPALVCALFVLLFLASTHRAWWKPWLPGLWVAVSAAAVVLLRGGMPGLSAVPSDRWGGLPLTLLLSTVGFAAAAPLAVALALGRRSQMPAIRSLSIAYIELVRGIPIVTFLFMAAVMFPLVVPQGFMVDKLLRAQVAFVGVITAYLAEVVRGGLEAVPAGQYEAAASLGLGFWPATLLVVLPQALRAAIPALVNTFIAFFKDTSLVAVIGLFDLLGAGKAVIADAKWVGFGVEVYLFAAFIYFAFCYSLSRYSRRVEQALLARRH